MTTVATASTHAGTSADAVAMLFAGDPTSTGPTVGVELELFPFLPSTDGGPPVIADIARSADALGDLPYVSFEPGGQLELHPPPEPSASRAAASVERLRREAQRRLSTAGIELVATGLDPWYPSRPLPLQSRSDRYLAMDAHYAAIGSAGRAFMRHTASTQICVGLRAGDAGRRQWLVANLVAPLLALAFGTDGRRAAVIRRADPARHHLRWIGLDPVEAYIEFAAGAARFQADHLSTLFPPVRPRGTYLEVRTVDSLGPSALAAATTTTTTLLADARATEAVLGCLPVTEDDDRRRWAAATSPHRIDRRTETEVREVVAVATR